MSVLLPFSWCILKAEQTKEELTMKAATVYVRQSRPQPRLTYPNAASRRQIMNRVMDLLLMGAIGMAFAAIVLFLALLA